MGKDFELNGKCLAYHGPLLYEARILKVFDPKQNSISSIQKGKAKTTHNSTNEIAKIPEHLRDGPAYFVHYKGWKATWDEWVNNLRILMFTPENLQLQKDLKAAAIRDAQPQPQPQAPSQPTGPGFGTAGPGSSTSPGSTPAATDEASLSSSSRGAFLSSAGGTNGTAHLNGHATAAAARSGSMSKKHHQNNNSGGGGENKKSRKNPTLEDEDEFLKRAEISLNVPDDLKLLLVDDWEYITKDNQLVKLPAKITVNEILTRYKKYYLSEVNKNSGDNNNNKKRLLPPKKSDILLDEIIEGLKLYFDRCLCSILLYKFERQQYMEISKRLLNNNNNNNTRASDIYGAEHLLRLFVSLPALIAQTSMDQQSVQILKESLEDMMKWMESNESGIFTREYENTTPSYESISRN